LAPLLSWLLSWLQGHQLDLAIYATLHRDMVPALVSVLCRGSVIPVAWQILPANLVHCLRARVGHQKPQYPPNG